MKGRDALLKALAVWSAVGLTILSQSVLAQEPVRYGVSVSHDTVTVGQPFEVRVRVRAPRGATVQFPDNPDTTATVQARDPRVVTITDSASALDVMATYRVAAWDIDVQPITLDDVIVSWAEGQRTIPLGGLEVYVRSVLPADSAQRVPKPARALWDTDAFPWWIVALVLAVLAIASLLWWWWKRRRMPRDTPAVDPFVRAMKEFSRLETMGLLDAGERTRFAALVVEVVRDYLAERYADAPLSLTSRELVAMIRRHPAVPWEPLSRVLHEADLAKFAAFALSEERARALARDAREIVQREHDASEALRAQADAAATDPRRAA